MIFLSDIDYHNHMGPMLPLPLRPLFQSFPNAKTIGSLHMRFCQTNTTKVAQSYPINIGRL